MVKKAVPSQRGEQQVQRYGSGTMPAGFARRDLNALDDAMLAAEIGLEKRLRTIVANVPIVLFSTDREGIVTVSDGRGLEAMGLQPGALIGRSALELYAFVRFVDPTGGDISGDTAFRRALDGEEVHGLAYVRDVVLDARLMPLYGGLTGMEIVGTIGVGTDVTERVRAEEALREHEGRLAATIDSIGEAVLATDAVGFVRHMNPMAEKLTGWSAGEAIGRPLDEVVQLLASASRTPIDDLFAFARGSARPSTVAEAAVVNRAGVAQPVAVTWALIRDHGGIVLTLRDTADERLAALALQRSEASFRALIEGSPEMILVHREGRVAYTNDALAAKLGYGKAELLGTAAYDLVHPADREGVVARTRELDIMSGIPRRVRFVRKDGAAVWAENVALRVEFDGAPAVLVIGRDVTERDEIHQELMRADRMASLGTLSAGVAHEINNPLTYVLANLDHVARRLRSYGASPNEELWEELPELTDSIEQAVEGATRVRQIVRDLMTFSRGHVDQKGVVDVRRVLEASIQMTTHELRHRARVDKRLREVPAVEANEARLGQVFLNLLVNAAHAIPEGDAAHHTVTVTTGTDPEGRAVVELSDTGAGIPPEHLSRIFDPFFTTRPTGSGPGLGLAIAHGIVKSFGGEMTVTSEVGKGSAFRIVLPPAPGYDETTRRNPTLYPGIVPRRSVLVIDDDLQVGDAIALSLSDEHDVAVTTDARAALDRLSTGERFDVILCDLMMPQMTGMDFYRELLRVAPQLVGRLVFMSGGAFTPRARAFVEGLPNRCIEKPPDIPKLRELVRRRGA